MPEYEIVAVQHENPLTLHVTADNLEIAVKQAKKQAKEKFSQGFYIKEVKEKED